LIGFKPERVTSFGCGQVRKRGDTRGDTREEYQRGDTREGDKERGDTKEGEREVGTK
jgi:hypothetical protein